MRINSWGRSDWVVGVELGKKVRVVVVGGVAEHVGVGVGVIVGEDIAGVVRIVIGKGIAWTGIEIGCGVGLTKSVVASECFVGVVASKHVSIAVVVCSESIVVVIVGVECIAAVVVIEGIVSVSTKDTSWWIVAVVVCKGVGTKGRVAVIVVLVEKVASVVIAS